MHKSRTIGLIGAAMALGLIQKGQATPTFIDEDAVEKAKRDAELAARTAERKARSVAINNPPVTKPPMNGSRETQRRLRKLQGGQADG